MGVWRYPSGDDATVDRWYVQSGQRVAKGDAIVSLSAEQAAVQVAAPADGEISQILADVGATVHPGDALVRVDGGDSTETLAPPASPAAASEKTTMATSSDSVVPILMPQVGNSMEEGTILSWKVAEGDRVEQGQIIYEVETDKAAVEIEADQAGRIAKIVAKEGDVVPIKEPVAYLAENDADVEAALGSGAKPATAEEKPQPKEDPAPSKEPEARGASEARSAGSGASDRPKASPAARKAAADRNVDLSAVAKGSGPGGRILSTDVPSGGAAMPTEVVAPAKAAAPQKPAGRETMSSMRKAIGKALQASKQTIPHFYIETTINAAAMMDLHRLRKDRGEKCSVNDVILLAAGRAVGEFASFRSRIDGDDLVTMPSANIGIAVGTDAGLVVPVILSVESMTLGQAAEASRAAVEAARAGKLQNAGKGVFTISNLGMFGTTRFSAIINPPEAAILAVGAVRDEPVVVDGEVKPGKVCSLTLSCDHRVIDGVEAAKFLARLRDLLENPGLLA